MTELELIGKLVLQVDKLASCAEVLTKRLEVVEQALEIMGAIKRVQSGA